MSDGLSNGDWDWTWKAIANRRWESTVCTPCPTVCRTQSERDNVSQLAVERVLGRLVTDEDFRAKFFTEPGAVCDGQGCELTAVELAALSRTDERALHALAQTLDARIVRALSLRFTQRERRPTPARNRSVQRGTR